MKFEAGVWKIYIPEWQSLATYSACTSCERRGRKGYNCRVCGKLYCNICTSKIRLLEAFKKKHKPGPSRVCNQCRFFVIGGKAQLIPRKQVQVRRRARTQELVEKMHFEPNEKLAKKLQT